MSNTTSEREAFDIEKALRRAFSLGQTYWQQADSDSWSQQEKSKATHAKFDELLLQARATQDAAPKAAVEALSSAPVLSKYHGMRGFEVERFIADYESWGEVARAALQGAAAPAQPDADALRLADAIDPLTRKQVPDMLTQSCAADMLRLLARAASTVPQADSQPHKDQS